MSRSIMVPCIAAALLMTLTGCQGGQPAAAAEPPPLGPVPTIRDARDISLPMDAYLAVVRTWHVPDLAINRLGRDCMRRFGLDWPVTGTVPPDSTAPAYPRRYGVFDADRVARYGYHPESRTGGSSTPRQEREPTLVEMAVWTGRGASRFNDQPVPQGGCGGEALRTLAGDAGQPPEVKPEVLANEAHKRAEQDSRVVAAFARWSACMSGRGFHYRMPLDASGDPRWQTERPTPTEIETAKADVACKLETNLVGIWYAAEVAYQKRIIEQNAQRLQVLKEYNDTVIRNAGKIVSAG